MTNINGNQSQGDNEEMMLKAIEDEKRRISALPDVVGVGLGKNLKGYTVNVLVETHEDAERVEEKIPREIRVGVNGGFVALPTQVIEIGVLEPDVVW